VTAGTEHNTLDLGPIERPASGASACRRQSWRSSAKAQCVAAAHQQLALNGKCGFTDGQGRLNPAFTTGDSRIRELARIGAAAIAQVHTN